MDGVVLEEKQSLRCWDCFSLLNWIGALTLSQFAKTVSKKIGALINSMKFLSPEVALHLINMLHSHAWNTTSMSGLVLLVVTCIY